MNWKEDERGHLLEVFRHDGEGQVFVVHVNPGQTRGNHWHSRKVEKFVVVLGDAVISMRHIILPKTTGRSEIVSGEFPRPVVVEPGMVHSITAGPDGCLALVWCNEHFNPEDADTYPEVV